MFDIGWSELLVIGVIALVVIGPKDLPRLLRTLGQAMTKLRSMAAEFQSQFQDAMREAELDELRKQAEKITSEVATGSFDPLKKVESEFQGALDTAERAAPAVEQPQPAAPPEGTAVAPQAATDAPIEPAKDEGKSG